MRLRNVVGMLALVLIPLLAWGQQKGNIEVVTTSKWRSATRTQKGKRR
jgi:hypothetical protein